MCLKLWQYNLDKVLGDYFWIVITWGKTVLGVFLPEKRRISEF